MHRFTTSETKHTDRKSHTRWLYLIAPLFLILFWVGVNYVSDTTVLRQQESLQNALDRDIIHCYAIEGFYPPSLEYLKDHYGLTYDESIFTVDYQPIGSNMRPYVTILVSPR